MSLDDDFDFGDALKKEPTRNRRPQRNNYDDLFDLDEPDNKLKLPNISTNKPQPQPKSTPKNKNDSFDLEELDIPKPPQRNIKPAPKHQSSFEEELVDPPKPPPRISKPIKKSQPSEEEEQPFEESLGYDPSDKKPPPPRKVERIEIKKEQPVPPPAPKAPEPEPENNYEEEFEAQDQYDQDFEDKPQPTPKKFSHQTNPPKPPLREKKVADSLQKPSRHSNRAGSRSTARSHDRSFRSRGRPEKLLDDGTNKYVHQAQKYCPDFQRTALDGFSMDKLTRQNDKIRGMIKKFNDELNDLINRNIMQLKNKKEDKVSSAEDAIRVLMEQKNSAETVQKTTLKELEKLKGKEGVFRETEVHLSLDEKIASCKSGITQATKTIKSLKFEVKNEGNKLTKLDKENNYVAEINAIKGNMMNARKEEDKNQEHLKRLATKQSQLASNMEGVEKRHDKCVQAAREKGIALNNHPQHVKKWEELKKKIDTGRQHRVKTQSLYKTKAELVVHELDQIRQQIKMIEAAIGKESDKCELVQAETGKTIEKARMQGKISPEMMVNIEQMITDLDGRATSLSSLKDFKEREMKPAQREKDTKHKEVAKQKEKDEISPFSNPKTAKKYHSVKNVEKVHAIAPAKQAQKAQDDSNINRPNLFKKKEKAQEKPDQRVWKNDAPSPHDRNASTPTIIPKAEESPKEEEKKKPFVIKKNRERHSVSIEQPRPVESVDIKKEQAKPEDEETPTIAPRMKFRKNKQEQPKSQQPEKPYLGINNTEPLKPTPAKQQEENTIFAPKRLNLKLKDRKNTDDGGYNATVAQKKEEAAPIEQAKSKPIEEYKPKGLSLQNNQPLFPQTKRQDAVPEQLPKQEEKPKFNLKLRDRQRDSNKQEPKIDNPTAVSKQPEYTPQRLAINLSDKPEASPSKENNNPYAKMANDAPKREREGPVKKPKVQPAAKQKFNIYDQAEEINEVKQAAPNSPPKLVPPPSQNEPDLNQLLGISKPKGGVDDDLLVGDVKQAGRPSRNKKDPNFFADLEL